MSDFGTTQWWKITECICVEVTLLHYCPLYPISFLYSTTFQLFLLPTFTWHLFLCWLLFRIKGAPWIFCIALETRCSLCSWNMWYCDKCAVEVKPCLGWLLVIIIVIWSTMRGEKDEQVGEKTSAHSVFRSDDLLQQCMALALNPPERKPSISKLTLGFCYSEMHWDEALGISQRNLQSSSIK